MKKRTKRKVVKGIGSAFRFIFKCIFIYPFQFIWWILKNIAKAIKEVAHKTKQNKKEDRKVEKNQKKSSKNKKQQAQDQDELSQVTYAKPGRLKVEPEYDELEEIKGIKGQIKKFTTKLYTNKSTIGLILGARGTGKSAIGMRILENFKTQTEKNIYCLGFKPAALPKWMSVIKNIDDIENDSVLLVDEGGIEFSSRKSMSDSNTLLSDILLIARHKDLSVLFITQNSANLEVNVIRQADYLVMKPSSLLQKDFERKKIKDVYSSVEQDFEELKDELGLTYLYADNYRGFVTNTLPTFWSEQASKGYSDR